MKRLFALSLVFSCALAQAQEVPPSGGLEWTLVIIEMGALTTSNTKRPTDFALPQTPANVVLTFATRDLCETARMQLSFMSNGADPLVGTGSVLQGHVSTLVMPCVQTK